MFTLDYKSRLPIYEQLYKDITRMAALGAIEQGEPLPSVRSLAQELGVNPIQCKKPTRCLSMTASSVPFPAKARFFPVMFQQSLSSAK